MISPDKIEAFGKQLRTKVDGLSKSIGVNYKPAAVAFEIIDDAFELIIALAQNQQELKSLVDKALGSPAILSESKKEIEK